MAQFLGLRGYRVFEALGCLWGHYRGPFFCSLPYQLLVEPEPGEIEEMLRKWGLSCVRFPSVTRRRFDSGLYVCRPREFSLERLTRQYRKQIERGMEMCEIRPVEPAELLREGRQLNLDTMERQRRYDPEFGDPAAWKRFVDAVRQSPGIAITGAYSAGRLSSYIITCREDGWLHLLYKMSRADDRAHRVGHALDYRLICDAAADPQIEAVGNSCLSILPNEGLDRYKRHMGYAVVPHYLAIYFHPRIAPLLTSRAAVAAARTAWKIRPRSPSLQLAAGILEGARITLTNPFPIVSDVRENEACQHTGCRRYARMWRPYPLFLLRISVAYLRKEGWRRTGRKVREFLQARVRHSGTATRIAARAPVQDGEVLALQPGEWVRVKSEQAIRATLDAQGKHRGLTFVPAEMLPHCGRPYRVLKRVEKIFLEESRQNRKLKNTVLLEGVHCQGNGLDCDRCCFLFWREAWLERISPPPSEVQSQ